MLRSVVVRTAAVSCIIVLIFTAAGSAKSATINSVPDKNAAVVRLTSSPATVSGKGSSSDTVKQPPVSAVAGRHQVHHLVSGNDRKQAAGSRAWAAPPPVVYVPHANAGAAQVPKQSNNVYPQQHRQPASSSLYQPLVGPIVNQQPPAYRVVRIYRPPVQLPVQPALLPPVAPTTNYIQYRPPQPPAPVYVPPSTQTLPPAPAPAAYVATPAAQPAPYPAPVVAPAGYPVAPVAYPVPSPPYTPVSIPRPAPQVAPVYQPSPAYQDVPASTTVQSAYVDDVQCPSLNDDPCQSLDAGLYGHPSASNCYIQCDEFGQSHVRPCAPGTSWKSDAASQDKPSLFNKCS